jgi:succinate dehydrogenase / fumarate reductase cytochrome b subunit
MAMSVAHRITGSALYAGTVLLTIWLVALASGPDAYASVAWFFGSPVGYLVLFGYTWILMHHMLGGVRHLIWDFGHGMEPTSRVWLARMTLIGSSALTILIWAAALLLR